jgi:hypothetical protein
LLSGYVDIIAANITDLGYEASAYETIIFDALPESTDKYYNFTVQVTDGGKFDTVNVRTLIVSKGNFTGDNDITVVNNTYITIDHDNNYRPIILNSPGSLPLRVSGDTFAYKFLAYDPEEKVVQWQVDELLFSGLDERDYPVNQTLAGDGSTGPYTMDRAAAAVDISVRINDTIYLPTVDYTTSGTDLTFTSLTPGATDVITILYIAVGTGFDSLLFDQGAEGLPIGLTIDRDTGWVFGTLPEQTEETKTYEVAVTAYRTLQPGIKSDPVVFSLVVQRTLNEEIVWETNENLGQMDNGAVSELTISAYNTLGKKLDYSTIYQPYSKLPQGLTMLTTGDILGRVSFRYFALDAAVGYLPVTNTSELVVGMSIQGLGVSAGCKITAIIDSKTIEVQPAIYVVQGTLLTFSNATTSTVASTTSNAITTSVDGGTTTFDQNCRFTVRATARDGSITADKSFRVFIRSKNLAPYENLYLKALPTNAQRRSYIDTVTNASYVPPATVYRPNDPYFGIQKNIKFLFLAGLSVSQASEMVASIALNHYTKSINFGEIKTARALDASGNVDYEVVYADIIDNQMFAGNSPPLSTTLSNANKYIKDGVEYGNTIYTNSFTNMEKRLVTGVGYNNKGAIPRWMTSVQKSGKVLGLTRAVPLVYTKPGSSERIAYRLRNSGFSLNSVPFTVDRYQWDNSLSKFFDTTTNKFLPSRDTTFDKFLDLNLGTGITTTSTISSVTNSNVIVVSDNLTIGYGWTLASVDTLSSGIGENVFVTNVQENVGSQNVTLSANVTAATGAEIRFDGSAFVDYAVSSAFNQIDSELLSRVKALGYVDGVTNIQPFEKLVFAKQFGFDNETLNDGWVRGDGTTFIYGYLEKLSGLSTVNQRGGVWQITYKTIPDEGFDESLGLDEIVPEFVHSRFDAGSDQEVRLEFISEVNVNQTVKIRGGNTYPVSTLQYTFDGGASTPNYLTFIDRVLGQETSFDGGSFGCKEGDPTVGGVRGGTAFGNNRDKYIIPESEDKYIKFPQNGVFV